MKRKPISGIYRLYWKESGKYYFGSSEDIDFRGRTHISNMKHGKHINKHVQDAYNVHGIPDVEVISTNIPFYEAIFGEQMLIKDAKKDPNCCNISHIPCNSAQDFFRKNTPVAIKSGGYLRMKEFANLHNTNRENIYRAIRVGQFDKRFPEWILIDSGTLERREYLFQKKKNPAKVLN